MSRSIAGVERRGLAAGALVVALLVRRDGAEPEALRWLEPNAVEWGHCGVVMRGAEPVCVYDPEEPVRLWIEHSRAAEARVWIDGVEALPERYSLVEEPQGGGLRVAIPAEARSLALEVPDEDGARGFALALEPGKSDDEPPEEPGAAARAAAEAWETDDAALIERTGRAAGDELAASGRAGDAVFTLCAGSFHLRRLRAFEAAERLLARAEEIGRGFAIGRAAVARYRGQLAWSRGALHDAAGLLREGARPALRLEDEHGLIDALPIYAEALAQLGYHAEARHWATASLRYLPEGVCNRARVVRTIGWIDLVLRIRGQPHDDPRPRLEQAIALYRTAPECAHEQAGARLSLALLALEDGDAATAERELEAIDRAALSAEDRVRAADLRVRLWLAAGAGAKAARPALRELEAAARVVDDHDARWRVEVRRGELLERDGDVDGALAAFEQGERHLDRLVRAQAVVGVGRTATADRYLEGTTALVSLLVAQGHEVRAACVMREARARRRSAALGVDALPEPQRTEMQAKLRRHREQKRLAEDLEAEVLARPLEQEPRLRHEAERTAREATALVDEIVEALVQATASPRCEELAPPGPGELLVGLHPREHDWLVVAQDERGTTVHEIAAPRGDELAGDPAALGEALLGPIDEALGRASRVRVLADREAQAIDVHALPWRGEPLAARVPVTYGVELPARPFLPLDGPPRALLLADPTGTLARAREEIVAVAERLEPAGWRVDAPETADPEAPFEPSFAGYSLLHYAAHTATRDGATKLWAPHPAGAAGGLPYLQIGPNARLEVHDVLALRPVPPVAFLAGCKTGLAELDAGSTSVALAFLLADGQQVVASRENLGDREALAIARRFYAWFGQGAGLDAAVAMHEVQRELWREREALVPYRVWVR